MKFSGISVSNENPIPGWFRQHMKILFRADLGNNLGLSAYNRTLINIVTCSFQALLLYMKIPFRSDLGNNITN